MALPLFDPNAPSNPNHPEYRITDKGREQLGAVDDNLRRKQYTPFQGYDETIQNQPNYEKLTPTERWIFERLPAPESTFGRLLGTFSESWVGNLLSKLDIPAEAVERGTGFATQWLAAIGDPEHMAEFQRNMGAAWYAGSLAADMANLPTFRRDAEGNITGFQVPTELPGVGGLIEARQKIAAGVPLEQVRDEYYESLGALSLRAQMYDTYVHILGDPINAILPKINLLSPERLNIVRRVALATKVSPETLGQMKNLVRALEEAGDVQTAAQVGARVTDVEKNLLTLWDRFAITVTGGVDIRPGLKKRWWNPFELRPEARAQELLTTLDDHLQAYIFNRTRDPREMVETLERAMQGTLGPEFGHAFLTEEGRIVQAFLAGSDAQGRELLAAWNLTEGERTLMNELAAQLGDDPASLLKKVVDDSPDVVNALGGETVGRLKVLEGVPVTPEEFGLKLGNMLKDNAARIAVSRYGVEARGLILKATQALKAAETLAFLRLNPAFAFRNWVNNEMTMIARGVTGTPFTRSIDDFWANTVKLNPHRLSQSFTMAGEATIGGRKLTAAETVIADALRGDPKGLSKMLDNFSRKASDVEFPLDMGKVAALVEENSSKRAFTAGFKQFWRRFWKPGRGFDRLEDHLPVAMIDDLRRIDPNLPDVIHQVVADAWNMPDLRQSVLAKLQGQPVRSVTGTLDDAAVRAGLQNLDEVLDANDLADIEQGLAKALSADDPVPAVRAFMNETREQARAHLRQVVEDHLTVKSGLVANQIQAEGPLALGRIFGDTTDYFWGAHVAHAQEMAKLSDQIRLLDPALADRFWKGMFKNNEEFFESAFDLYNASLKGMRQGAKEAGLTIPKQFTDEFGRWRTSNRAFFKKRNQLLNEFFEARLAGKEPPRQWREIQEILDQEYLKLADLESEVTGRMDGMLAATLRQSDPDKAEAFMAWRKAAHDLRRADKEAVIAFRAELESIPSLQRTEAWREFWRLRQRSWDELWRTDRAGSLMMQGDAQALDLFRQQWNNRLQVALGQSGLGSLDEAIELFRQAPDDPRLADLGPLLASAVEEAPEGFTGNLERIFLDDLNAVVPGQMPYAEALPQYWYSRVFGVLDEVEDAAVEAARKPAITLGGLPGDSKKAIQSYLNRVEGQMGDARYASVRMGEFRRDAALLNYNRRYNYNTWLSTIFPFEFWMTQSVAKWALHSLDRPQMLMTALRIKEFLNTAGAEQQGFPSRLKGMIRFPFPHLPDWMGDAFFFDPLRVMLPFDQMAAPYVEYQRRKLSIEGRTERALERMVRDGLINEFDMQQALEEQQGPVWERAQAQVLDDDENLRSDPWDFISLFASPHAPIAWAKELVEGTPEEIGPFLPLTRTSRQVSGLLGVNPWIAPHNIEGSLRKHFGLPAFDQWDDYRVDRMLSNMAAEGVITTDEALRAMIDRQGPVYDRAQERANREFAAAGEGIRGSVPGILKIIGIPVQGYPEGEQMQRSLQDDFARAWEARERGDESALSQFFDDHPEYEARLALWDEPEERLRNFLVSNIWDVYTNLPKVHKDEVREQLGDQFNIQFLNRDTRSYEGISLDTLQMWVKMLGGDPPGSFEGTPLPIPFSDPDKAYRVQVFYDVRDQFFNWPAVRTTQNQYFTLAEGQARRQFLAQHPELKEYWDWRRDFMARNPELAPYLTDDPEKIPKAPTGAVFEEQPFFSWDEWRTALPAPLERRLLAHFREGEGLSEPALESLEQIASQMGLEVFEALQLIGNALDRADRQ